MSPLISIILIALSDVDECALKSDDCQQKCTNKDGGFDCSCETGFTLNADKKNCDQGRLYYIVFHYY